MDGLNYHSAAVNLKFQVSAASTNACNFRRTVDFGGGIAVVHDSESEVTFPYYVLNNQITSTRKNFTEMHHARLSI